MKFVRLSGADVELLLCLSEISNLQCGTDVEGVVVVSAASGSLALNQNGSSCIHDDELHQQQNVLVSWRRLEL